MCMGVSYKKKFEKYNLFASLKSLKKAVGSTITKQSLDPDSEAQTAAIVERVLNFCVFFNYF
jgi:hypothetical protein